MPNIDWASNSLVRELSISSKPSAILSTCCKLKPNALAWTAAEVKATSEPSKAIVNPDEALAASSIAIFPATEDLNDWLSTPTWEKASFLDLITFLPKASLAKARLLASSADNPNNLVSSVAPNRLSCPNKESAFTPNCLVADTACSSTFTEVVKLVFKYSKFSTVWPVVRANSVLRVLTFDKAWTNPTLKIP